MRILFLLMGVGFLAKAHDIGLVKESPAGLVMLGFGSVALLIYDMMVGYHIAEAKKEGSRNVRAKGA